MIDNGNDFLKEADFNQYKSNYKHLIGDKLKTVIEVNAGHGGMDFEFIYKVIGALNNTRPMDMDVHDATT